MEKVVKLWYPEDLFDSAQRHEWHELLKSRQRFTFDGRELDANIQKHINWVTDEKEADIFVLPQLWNYYYERGRQQDALAFCKRANEKGKKIISHTGGDQGFSPPVPVNTILYRQSGYRSKRKINVRTAPFFLSDPINVFLGLDESEVLQTNPVQKPIVGFCGMAPHGLAVALKERAQIFYRNWQAKKGKLLADQEEILSSSNLRYAVLKAFDKASTFKTNYIIRQKYRGGEQTPENRQKTTKEYYQNQIDSDLIVCVRGVGNFSLRFYETLAMGRIPVFVDTDSPLPDISPLNWHDYIIWVDRKDIKNAPKIAAKWLENRNLREQQAKNRQLWVDYFRLDNYWIRELKQLSQ